MDIALRVLKHLLVGKLVHRESTLKTLIRAGQGVALLSGIFMILGLSFLIYAAFLSFLPFLSSAPAAALTGAGALAVSALVATCGYMILKRKTKLHIKQNIKSSLIQEMPPALHPAFDLLEDELTTLIRHHPKKSLLLASLAGFLSIRSL